MPGLKQSRKISNHFLKKNMARSGYEQMLHTPALRKHTSRDIVFALVVDGFGIKYSNRQDSERLSNALQSLYPVTIDWTGYKIGTYPKVVLHKQNI